MGRQPGAPVRSVRVDTAQVAADRWPCTVPAVAQLVRDGLELDPGVTILLGANGSGKSTIVEALAAAWARRVTTLRSDWLQQTVAKPSDEDSDLYRALQLHYTPGGPIGGLFLRAERMHAQTAGFTERGRWGERLGIGRNLLERSHGEGFLEVLSAMVGDPGLYVLDEPEAALSFDGCLILVALLAAMRDNGSQVVLATHSPILAAFPGARLLQLDDDGMTPIAYEDTDLVQAWRSFLDNPQAYLRHLVPLVPEST